MARAPAEGSAAMQVKPTSLAQLHSLWMEPIIQARMVATNLSREALLERAERRFQPVYTVCVALRPA